MSANSKRKKLTQHRFDLLVRVSGISVKPWFSGYRCKRTLSCLRGLSWIEERLVLSLILVDIDQVIDSLQPTDGRGKSGRWSSSQTGLSLERLYQNQGQAKSSHFSSFFIKKSWFPSITPMEIFFFYWDWPSISGLYWIEFPLRATRSNAPFFGLLRTVSMYQIILCLTNLRYRFPLLLKLNLLFQRRAGFKHIVPFPRERNFCLQSI